MGFFITAFGGFVHLIVVAMDIIIVLLLVHLLNHRFSWEPLEAFDRVGRPLVEEMKTMVRKPLESRTQGTMPDVNLAAITLIGVGVARFIVAALYNAFISA